MITDQVVEFLWWLMRRTGLESNLNDFEANYRSGFIIYIHCTPAEAGLEWERCVSLSIFAQFKCKNFCLGFKAQCKIKFTYSPTESEEALKFLVKMLQDSWNEYLQHKLLNMYKMLQVKVDCLARNLNFQKNTLKTSPNYKQLWDILALKIDGCQTVDTRSTFGVPLENLGYRFQDESVC